MFLPQGSLLRGALFSFLGFTIWACGDALTKLAGTSGVSPFLLLEISGWSGALVIFLGLAFRRKLHRLRVKRKKLQALRLALLIFCNLVSVVVFMLLPLTTVYIGIFGSPFLISLFGASLFGEKISRSQAVAIVVGFLGVLLALSPEFLNEAAKTGHTLLGYVMLPVFMLLFVADMLFLRVLGRTETSESLSFFPFFFRAAVLLPFLWIDSVSQLPLQPFLFLLVMGACGGIGYLLMATAYKLAPVAIVSPFHYTQLVTGAIFGYLLWGDVPSPWVWGGGFLIVVSGLVCAREAHRSERL